jgi:hypothetical protein
MKHVLLLAALVPALAGCASVTRGFNDTVEIYYDPPQTKVSTNLGHVCTSSPCSLEIPRKKSFTVTAELDGYAPQTVQVESKLAPGGVAGMAGNVLVGGVIGVGIDAATGATLEHFPNPVLVEMMPTDPDNAETPKGDLSEIKNRLAEEERKRQKVLTN